MVTLGHHEPLPLLKHLRVVALTPNLQRVFIYNITKFLQHSYTIKPLLLLILIKWFYLSFKALVLC